MPRDVNGFYSRTVPPGAAGYQAGTIWDANVVNAEVNDIGNELTNSLTKNGTTLPTANLPMAGFVHSGLGMADADGETLRFQALKKGSNISITSSGVKTIPAEGSYFELTGTGFNITGFNANYDGRIVNLELPAGLTLVNGTNLLLKGGLSKTTFAGDIITLVNKSGSIWKEINYQYALGAPSFKVSLSSTFARAAGAVEAELIYNISESDAYGMYDNVTGICTIPTSGLYSFGCQISVALSTITRIRCFAKKNGANLLRSDVATGLESLVCGRLYGQEYFNAGDTVVFYWQVLGSGTGTQSGSPETCFAYLSKLE